MTPLERITQLVNINGDVNILILLVHCYLLRIFLLTIISMVQYVAM
jgi:hypothetical protein